MIRMLELRIAADMGSSIALTIQRSPPLRSPSARARSPEMITVQSRDNPVLAFNSRHVAAR